LCSTFLYTKNFGIVSHNSRHLMHLRVELHGCFVFRRRYPKICVLPAVSLLRRQRVSVIVNSFTTFGEKIKIRRGPTLDSIAQRKSLLGSGIRT
jgi:poly-beta-hydroxyalkanoate depolymerase